MAADPVYVKGTNSEGQTIKLLDSRTPALFTGDFGDCMGGQSLINVTTFDAAYYKDNMTVLFHLGGNTNLQNESIMSRFSSVHYGGSLLIEKNFSPHWGASLYVI
jgi:hypothetical protein